ncbi:hypothetical protein JFT33_27505 [Pseudomonas carnis]|jgi:trimethylamine:corrinoid methyltransferase-like protein|uniref:hypothetical protein n=1 Tax=Pseudomonas carnis TaxID=2487355 RepID=UPI0018E8A183|nr:hypothetical protein [Pseudomonas carnis]MBJ2210336.1 hypothetical protein [Pseudomonas carnis]
MAKTPITTLRLSEDVLARVDAYAARIQAETGVEINRTAALRALVLAGLEVKEKRKD